MIYMISHAPDPPQTPIFMFFGLTIDILIVFTTIFPYRAGGVLTFDSARIRDLRRPPLNGIRRDPAS